MHILLVEDDAMLADGIARWLRQAGHAVDWVQDGIAADRWLGEQNFDAVILDLGLPGQDGTEVLKHLRSRGNTTPALVLSAREALDERLKLLNLGADDFVVKPVALAELEARLRALVRRGQAVLEPEIRLGKLTLDLSGRCAWAGEKPLELTAREWSALEYLAVRANRIVNKEQIMHALYSLDEEISPNAVEKFISRLRAKLAEAGVSIRTVRGLGYMLEQLPDHGEKSA